MVDRDARGVLIALVSNRSRYSPVAQHFSADEIVQLCRRNPRLHQGPDIVQNHGRNPAGLAHAGKIGILIDANAILGDPAPDIVHVATLLLLATNKRNRRPLPEGVTPLYQCEYR